MSKPKSNAQKCAEYRKRQGKSIILPFPEGIHQALADLMEWHGYEDRREAISTMILNAHRAGPEGSKELFDVTTHDYTPSEELVRNLQIQGARAREEI